MERQIMDVAKEAGVSQSTVSRVLNGFKYVSDETKSRVLSAVKKLDYSPNISARALRMSSNKKTINRNLGFLIPKENMEIYMKSETSRFGDSYLSKVLIGALQESSNLNFKLTSEVEKQLYTNIADLPLMIKDSAIDGIISAFEYHEDFYKEVIKREIPIIGITSQTTKINTITMDNVQGAYDAVKYLINNGHRKIGIFTGCMGSLDVQERLLGAKRAVESSGLKFENVIIEESVLIYEGGYKSAENLLKKGDLPTAIFAMNDFNAIGAKEAFEKHGLKIPDDISIIGFDDIDPASSVKPALTTIRVPRFEMGKIAVKKLYELIIKNTPMPLKTVVPVKLIERESVRKI